MSRSFFAYLSQKIPGIWFFFLLWEFGILPGVIFLVDSSFFSYFRSSQSVKSCGVGRFEHLAWASTPIVSYVRVCPSSLTTSWYIKGAFISFGSIPYWMNYMVCLSCR